jgi:hypothetical protein
MGDKSFNKDSSAAFSRFIFSNMANCNKTHRCLVEAQLPLVPINLINNV